MKDTLKYYSFITVATLFIGIAFTSADFFTSPVDRLKDTLILCFQWGVLMLALWPIIYLISINKYIFAVLYPFICLLSGVLAYFRYTTGTILTTAILDVISDNHSQSTVFNFSLILAALGCLVVPAGLVVFRFRKIKVGKCPIHYIVAIAFIFIMFHIPRIQRPVKNRIPFNLYFVTSQYFIEREEALTERAALSECVTCEEDKNRTVVFVIGEALRADHLNINGYKKNTTPYLSNEDIVSFPHIYSKYTYTDASLAHILTRADSIHPELGYKERSFIDLFKQCGYYTGWLAHQKPTKSYVYFMHECDTLIYINANKSPYVFDKWVDGDMLPAFDALITGKERKTLVILHTIGSHWYYNSHYTDEFERFTPVTKSRIVSSNTREEMINSYDNTALYTDYFLHELIERLRDRKAILFYLSDHGEALGENGVWLHAADAPPMHHPACFVWMSSSYKSDHPEKYDTLQRNKNRRYRTDFLFPTITEAAGIQTDRINPPLSLFR